MCSTSGFSCASPAKLFSIAATADSSAMIARDFQISYIEALSAAEIVSVGMFLPLRYTDGVIAGGKKQRLLRVQIQRI